MIGGYADVVCCDADVQEAAEDSEDTHQSGMAWCFAAILAFIGMLLIRHILGLFDNDTSGGRPAHHQDADHSHDPFGMDGSFSTGMLVVWLIVRFLVILIPMYAVLRVMHTIREQQMQQDADRDLEQEMMTLLWVCIQKFLLLACPCRDARLLEHADVQQSEIHKVDAVV